MRWMVVLLVMVAFAGCTDAPDAGTDGMSEDKTPDLPTSDELMAMSASERTSTCADPVIECTFNWVEETVETPVDWSGHTKEGVWLLCDGTGGSVPVAGVSGCQGQQIQPDGGYQTTQDFEWNLTGVDLTLEWTPADATQTGLALHLMDSTGGTPLGTWEGSSTFTVAEDLRADGSTQLMFQVWPVAKDGGGNYVDVTQQEFTLTGSILSTHPVLESIDVRRADGA